MPIARHSRKGGAVERAKEDRWPPEVCQRRRDEQVKPMGFHTYYKFTEQSPRIWRRGKRPLR